MTLNNNQQKAESAAGRLVRLPVVRSACAKLSVFYTDAKCSHPNLKTLCEVLENSVTVLGTMACDRVSTVIVKLEPQISIANGVACKSLDWLESAFPVLHAPTEEIVACAADKMLAVREAVSITAKGTMDTVEHVMGRVLQVDNQTNQPVVERAISVASLRLDSALNMSEALIDRVLPPTEDDKEEDSRMVEGFETKPFRSYPTRLVSLTSKLYRRTYKKVMGTLSRSLGLVQDLQTSWSTLVINLRGLPQYLQYQAVSLLFFISQMYNLSHPSSQENHHQVRRLVSAIEASPTQKDVFQIHAQERPDWKMRRPTNTSAFKHGCNIKGCVHR